MRFMPSDRISASQALDMISSISDDREADTATAEVEEEVEEDDHLLGDDGANPFGA